MENLKFRAWDKEKREMIYPPQNGNQYILIDLLGLVAIQEDKELEVDFVSHIEIMQYTGLKDKNGVESYKSDYIRNKFLEGVIVFEAGCFSVLIKKINKYPCGYDLNQTPPLYAITDFEIIGNTYENPELLINARL